MGRREKTCGIYKITSPSGRIYIGESVDILTRWVSYRNLSCKGQPKLLGSLKKYSPENHIREVADEWKEKLDPRVYNALYNHIIEITD